MNDRTDQEALEVVLEAYVANAEDPNHASLAEWIRRYPQYERELTEVAVAWSQMERLPAAPRAQELATDILVLRGMSIFQNIRHRQSAVRGEEESIEGIVTTASQHGLSIDKLADLLELTVALVRKLDLRRFVYERIPSQLKDAVASTLGCSRAVVERYLQGPPKFAPGVRHKANQAPTLSKQEDFFDAVRRDRDLTEDRRQRWLDFEPPKE